MKNNIEKLVEDIVGEADAGDRFVACPMTMRDLLTTLTDKKSPREFLADLSSASKIPTTQDLLDIPEDEELPVNFSCQTQRITQKTTPPTLPATSECEPSENHMETDSRNPAFSAAAGSSLLPANDKGPEDTQLIRSLNQNEREHKEPDHADFELDPTNLRGSNKETFITSPKTDVHHSSVRTGRRYIVDPLFMHEEFHRALDDHLEKGTCIFRHIQFYEELKLGLRTQFRFRCTQCELIMIVNSDQDDSEFMDLNHAAVSGII